MSEWLEVRVVERREEADDIVALVLQSANGAPLPAYEAGAHIDVKLPNGLVRQYSLCGDPDRDDCYGLGILKEANGRGGSLCVHEQLHEGSRIEISAPRNLFALAPARRSILLAGGIGVTPILAMAEQLSRAGSEFEMHYCVRTEERAAFRSRIASSPFADCVHFHFDDRPGTRLDAASLLAAPEPETHVYVCGPDGFMDYVLSAARAAGWPESNIHFERFSGPVGEPGDDAPFEIAVEGSDCMVSVAAGQSALEALNAAGFDIPTSCEQGICGTCLTEVVDGIPDHRDMFLSEAEQAAGDCFTPCCSRALSSSLTIRI